MDNFLLNYSLPAVVGKTEGSSGTLSVSEDVVLKEVLGVPTGFVSLKATRRDESAGGLWPLEPEKRRLFQENIRALSTPRACGISRVRGFL